MDFLSVRRDLAALLLGATLLAPAMAQTVLALPAARAPGADMRQALTLPPGGTLRLERLPLDDHSGELVSAELRRTNMGTTAPLLVEHSGSEVTTTRPAPRAHFVGQLVGDPQSSVFLSIDSQGAMRSIVRRGQEVFVSDQPAPSTPDATGTASLQAPALRARRVEFTSDAPAKPFACGVNNEFIEKNYAPPSAALLENLRNNHQRAGLLGVASRGAEALGAQRRADIIIETDYELFQRLGSSGAVHAYVTDLLGYASSQYESEIGVRLNVTQINVYSSTADPWSGSSTGALLDELQAYWNAPSRINQARHHVHLLSGRDTNSGVAYVDTLDSASKTYAYGVSGSIKGNFSASNPQVIWESVVVAHEIGHAFGSDHTHNYDEPFLGSNQGGAIDCCVSEDGAQCITRLGGSGRTGVLPGVNSVIGGVSGTGAGTIMSYCQFPSGGMSNISFNFGTNHTRGVNPWRVASVLQSSAQTHLPLDTVAQNHTLSVSRQGTGSGTVTSAPVGINCGSTCSASYTAGTPVTLTAQAASGSSFTGWSGACSGTADSCNVSMDSARSVTASFTSAPVQRLITLSKSGTGTGSVTSSPSGLICAADCGIASSSFASNTSVTLVAQAASGSTFVGWSGACNGTGNCTIPADTSSANMTASFNTTVSGTRTVSLSKSGTGTGSVTSSPAGLSCAADCANASTSFASNTAVTLVAQAASGSTFSGWSGVCSGTGTCTIPAGSSSASVTASFNPTATSRPFVLNKAGSGTGSVTITPPGFTCDANCTRSWPVVTSSAVVTLVAQASAGSTFTGWSGACSGTGNCIIAAGSSAVDVTASFNTTTAPRFTLIKAGSGKGSVTIAPYGVTCDTSCTIDFYNPTATVLTLTAQAASGSTFAGWSGACTGTGTCTVTAGISAVDVTASFNTGGGTDPLASPVDFVTQQYIDFLRRTPDSTGLNFWVNQLNAGTATRAQVIESMMYSTEFRGRFGPLVRLYTAYFQRVPDYAGLMYWFDRMYPISGTATSLAQVSDAFAQSSEFVNIYGPLDNAGFIMRVYQNVLGRNPDTAGYTYWLGQLNAGMPRGQVMTAFSESTENQNATANSLLITMTYVGMLRRSPEAGGYAWWLAEVNAGRASVLSLITSFLNSSEYADRF